jgi:hypothetical protein
LQTLEQECPLVLVLSRFSLSLSLSLIAPTFCAALRGKKLLLGLIIVCVLLVELSFVVEFEERRRKMALPMNEADIFEDVNDELAGMTPEDILRRSRLLENEIRVLKVRRFCNHLMSFFGVFVFFVFFSG